MAPPPRIVHLGLGGFFRAHTAWYTAHAADAEGWGIVAFTGQSRDLVDRLAAQEGLYTLTTRHPGGDTVEVVPSVVAVHPGTDTGAWRRAVAAASTTVVTVTATEAAYTRGPGSVATRLVDALQARRAADAGPLTVVPGDNLADNGRVLTEAVRAAVDRRGGSGAARGLGEWIAESVAVVDTVVDRITPRPTAADVAAARSGGYADAAPVVTEPFSEWIIAGTFAAAHPDWASAGARHVDDVTPFARRKLHLLNGAHSLLAYGGLLRGHREVAEALADDALAAAVAAWWDEAAEFVGGAREDRAAYRDALVRRFANPRMHHALAQIAIDGSAKLPVRVVPVARAELAAGRRAEASATILGAWIAFVRRVGADLADARRADVLEAASAPSGDLPRRLLALLDPELADHDDFVAQVADLATAWGDSRKLSGDV